MQSAGTVSSLHRYPVKSMMGEALNAAQITPRGLLGDRVYALCDTQTHKVASAKNPGKWPSLFNFRATYVSPPEPAAAFPPVRVTLPDGSLALSTSGDFSTMISSTLGRSVTLLANAPQSAQLEEYWPDMEELPKRDVITDEAMPPGTFFDCAMVHLLTTATLEALRSLYPAGRFEPRRFRPNLIVSTPPDVKGFIENDWIGKVISIGDQVQLKITGPCPRCVMTTLAQDDLPRDPLVLKTAAKHNGAHVGVYASVIRGGMIRRGDEITVEPIAA